MENTDFLGMAMKVVGLLSPVILTVVVVGTLIAVMEAGKKQHRHGDRNAKRQPDTDYDKCRPRPHFDPSFPDHR